jgi:hypothetical protein
MLLFARCAFSLVCDGDRVVLFPILPLIFVSNVRNDGDYTGGCSIDVTNDTNAPEPAGRRSDI